MEIKKKKMQGKKKHGRKKREKDGFKEEREMSYMRWGEVLFVWLKEDK